MTPRNAEALTLLLPLTLVVPLLWHDFSPADQIQNALAPTGIVLLALGAVAFVLGARYFRPGYSFEQNNWGIVLALAAIGLYFLGSVQSITLLHWAAGALLYVAAVVFIGGPYSAAVVLPTAAAVFAVASGLAQNLLVEVPLGLTLVTYMAATFRLDSVVSADPAATCPHCERRAGSGLAYCSYCGRRHGPLSVRIRPVKVGTVLLTSLFILLLAFAQPVAFNVTQSGVNYTTYSMSGIQVQPLLNTPPIGWSIAKVTHAITSDGTTMTYDLSSTHSTASLLVKLSSSPYARPSILPANFSKVTPAGSMTIDDQILTKYSLTARGGAAFTGLAWSEPISYLSGGQVSTGVLSFLATEPSSSYDVGGGSDLVAITSSLLDRTSAPQAWNVYLANIGSYILKYSSYTVPSAGVAGLLLAVGALRGRELGDSRVVDNAFGLSREEFSLYAILSREAPLQTAADYEAAAIRKGLKWNDFYGELGKLERLGLMSSHVRVRGGTPRLLWKCELA